MIVVIFVAIALVMAVGIVFLTGKGLGFLYADKTPMTDEEMEEYTKHTNPVHMCRFIGSCTIAGALVALLFTIGFITGNQVLDIVSICVAGAVVMGALIAYLVVFRYRPMKAQYQEFKANNKEEKPVETTKETATSKRIKAVKSVRK